VVSLHHIDRHLGKLAIPLRSQLTLTETLCEQSPHPSGDTAVGFAWCTQIANPGPRSLALVGSEVARQLRDLRRLPDALDRLDPAISEASLPSNHPEVTASREHLTTVLRALEEQPPDRGAT
jgi:hypothetical protein